MQIDKAIIDSLKNCRDVFLASHINPDGDALGSLIALGNSLKSIGKNITMYNESPIPAVFRFLPLCNRINHEFDDHAEYDTAVILDCSDLDRIGQACNPIKHVKTIINIDHHTTNKLFGHYQLIQKGACSTCEIVYRVIEQLDIKIDYITAMAIYTGIFTDTGSFRFSNTNKSAFSICDKMVELGVTPYWVASNVYGTYSIGRIKLLNLALDSIEISKNGKMSVMTITRGMMEQTGTHQEDVDGMITYAKSIEDVKVAVLIQENINGQNGANHIKKYNVSLRSDGTVDVAKIASSFGGGGHLSASGFSIESTLPLIKSQLSQLAEAL